MRHRIIGALIGAALASCLATSALAQAVKTYYPEEARSKLYSSGIMVDKTFFVAGAGSAIPGGGGQHEAYRDQVRQCLENIRRTLNMAGLDYEHVVKAWVMLDDLNDYHVMNDVFREVFPHNPPARTTLGINTIPQGNHIEITVIAHADLSEIKAIGAPPGNLPFSQGILAGNTLYISGKGDQLPDGSHPETFEERVRQCLRNVGSVLEEAGLDHRHVVWSNVYLDNYDNLRTFNKVYREFFKKGQEPARANVIVNELPGGCHVEVTCIATTDLASRRVVSRGGNRPGPNILYEGASPAVWAGDMLYMSAQYGGKGSLEQQLDQVMKSHADILKRAGLESQDIVSANVFLKDIEDYNALNKVYPNYFTQGRPSVRTCFMPFGGDEANNILLRAYFFAARTR